MKILVFAILTTSLVFLFGQCKNHHDIRRYNNKNECIFETNKILHKQLYRVIGKEKYARFIETKGRLALSFTFNAKTGKIIKLESYKIDSVYITEDEFFQFFKAVIKNTKFCYVGLDANYLPDQYLKIVNYQLTAFYILNEKNK